MVSPSYCLVYNSYRSYVHLTYLGARVPTYSDGGVPIGPMFLPGRCPLVYNPLEQVRYKPTLDIEAMFTTLANQLGPQPLFNVRTICGWVKTCQSLLVYQYLRE